MGRIKGKTGIWDDLGFKESTFNKMRGPNEYRELSPVDEYEFKGLSKKYFEMRTIYENRVLAQRIGVESATTLNRRDLIERLVEKVWGIQPLQVGYRPTDTVDVSKVTADIELDILEQVKNGEVIIGLETEGVFYSKGNCGLLYNMGKSFNDVIIDTVVVRNLIGEFALKDGDLIKGRAKYYPELKYYALFKIDEINGKSVLKGRNETPSVAIEPTIQLAFKNSDLYSVALQLVSPVYKGQFGVISTAGRMDFTRYACDLYNSVDCDNKMLFVLGEKQVVIDRIKKEQKEKDESDRIYYTDVASSEDSRMLKNILEYASRQARDGQADIVIVINDLDMIKATCNGVTARDLVSACGAFENGGSLTVIAFASTVSALSAYYEVRNKLDFELALKAGIEITQNKIDALASYSFAPLAKKHNAIAMARIKQIALTEGEAGVERRLADGKNFEEILSKLEY